MLYCSDYGYMHPNNALTGDCVADQSVVLEDPCTGGNLTYKKSQGYRKVAGDVCVGGDEYKYAPIESPCMYIYTNVYTGHGEGEHMPFTNN